MTSKEQTYQTTYNRIKSLLSGITEEVACLSTISCEVFHAFETFHWVGFYRVTAPKQLMVGPYQGGHGCLSISFDRGVCGAAARTERVQLVNDVHAVEDHIACSSSTLSEIVLPVFDSEGNLKAVFDIDSDLPANFDSADEEWLTKICVLLQQSCYK